MPLPASQFPFWRFLLIAGALAFVYATVGGQLGRDWWHDANYSHGLLVPFVAGYLLWDERFSLQQTQLKPSFFLGGALVLTALAMLWLGTAGAELYLQRLSLVVMLAGIAVYFWGLTVLRWVALPLFLLWLALPLPALILNRIAFPLQLFASRCAMDAMQLLDIPVLRQGNVIELLPRGALTTKKLEVAEACSGIRSLMALVMLATVWAYLSRPGRNRTSVDGTQNRHQPDSWGQVLRSFSFWRGVFLVATAVPIAIVTNALRVSGTGVLAHFYGLRVAEGFFHSFSGWVVYVVAFGLLWATAWAFDRITRARV